MFDWKYLELYITIITKNYKQLFHIYINKSKSTVIAKTSNETIKSAILSITINTNDLTQNIKVNFEGNIYFCGVPHGTKEFICKKMLEYCVKMDIRTNYIDLIDNEFVKFNIVSKFYIYGKIMYILRTVKQYDEWTSKLNQIHNKLERHALNGVSFVDTMSSQVPLSSGSGGLGLRPPSIFKSAAKISSVTGKGQLMTRFFLFHYKFNVNLHNNDNIDNNINNSHNNNVNNSGNNLTTNMVQQLDSLDIHFRQKTQFDNRIPKRLNEISLKYNCTMASSKLDVLVCQNVIFSKCISDYFDRVDQILCKFTNVTQNKVQYDPTQHVTHRDLIRLIDNFLLTQYYQNYNKYNSARLKSQSVNGASKWMNVPYNNIFGKRFSNKQFILSKSLYLGSKITQNNQINCHVCKKQGIDQYGYHALSCPGDGLMTKRHDAICDKLFQFCEMANLEVEKEKRYEDDGQWQ